MSQAGSRAKDELVCRECGEVNFADARECWICHGTRWKARRQGTDHAPSADGFFATPPGWVLVAAGIGLALGLYKLFPGVLMVVMVFVLPPVVVVELWAARRRNAWSPMSIAQRIGLFLLLLVLLPVVLVGALCIALFAICSLNGPPTFH